MTAFRIVVASISAVMLLGLAGLSLKWGAGHAMLEPWMIEASRARLQGQWLDQKSVEAGRQSLARAQTWHDRADAHELLGHYSLAAARLPQGSQADLKLAAAQFEAAVSHRPSMPYSWAHLALAKYALGETDARFFKALESAMRLGPWEAPVQGIAADLGLAVLDEVPVQLRAAILDNVGRGLVYQSDLMWNLTLKRGKKAQVCERFGASALKARCTASQAAAGD